MPEKTVEKTDTFKKHEEITKNFMNKEESKDASALLNKDPSLLTDVEKEVIKTDVG